MPLPINLSFDGENIYSRVGAGGREIHSVITDDSGNKIPLQEALGRLSQGERLQLHTGQGQQPVPIISDGKRIVQQETATPGQTIVNSAESTVEHIGRGVSGLGSNLVGLVSKDGQAAMQDYAQSEMTQHRPPSGEMEQFIGSGIGSGGISAGGAGVAKVARMIMGSRKASVLRDIIATEAGQAAGGSYLTVYNESIEQGLDEEEANHRGLGAALGSGAVTKGTSKIIFGNVGDSASAAMGMAGREPVQEFFQEGGQHAVEQFATGKDPTVGLGDAAGKGFAAGLFMGSGILSTKVSAGHIANINDHSKLLADEEFVRQATDNALKSLDGKPGDQEKVKEHIAIYKDYSNAVKGGQSASDYLSQFPEKEQIKKTEIINSVIEYLRGQGKRMNKEKAEAEAAKSKEGKKKPPDIPPASPAPPKTAERKEPTFSTPPRQQQTAPVQPEQPQQAAPVAPEGQEEHSPMRPVDEPLPENLPPQQPIPEPPRTVEDFRKQYVAHVAEHRAIMNGKKIHPYIRELKVKLKDYVPGHQITNLVINGIEENGGFVVKGTIEFPSKPLAVPPTVDTGQEQVIPDQTPEEAEIPVTPDELVDEETVAEEAPDRVPMEGIDEYASSIAMKYDGKHISQLAFDLAGIAGQPGELDLVEAMEIAHNAVAANEGRTDAEHIVNFNPSEEVKEETDKETAEEVETTTDETQEIDETEDETDDVSHETTEEGDEETAGEEKTTKPIRTLGKPIPKVKKEKPVKEPEPEPEPEPEVALAGAGNERSFKKLDGYQQKLYDFMHNNKKAKKKGKIEEISGEFDMEDSDKTEERQENVNIAFNALLEDLELNKPPQRYTDATTNVQKISDYMSNRPNEVGLENFSTHPIVAYAMSIAADLKPKSRVLEPSAGVGNIAVFLPNATLNEKNNRRATMLSNLTGKKVFKRSLLQLSKQEGMKEKTGKLKKFSAVVMTPPTNEEQKHTTAAWEFVKEKGRMVILTNRETEVEVKGGIELVDIDIPARYSNKMGAFGPQRLRVFEKSKRKTDAIKITGIKNDIEMIRSVYYIDKPVYSSTKSLDETPTENTAPKLPTTEQQIEIKRLFNQHQLNKLNIDLQIAPLPEGAAGMLDITAKVLRIADTLTTEGASEVVAHEAAEMNYALLNKHDRKRIKKFAESDWIKRYKPLIDESNRLRREATGKDTDENDDVREALAYAYQHWWKGRRDMQGEDMLTRLADFWTNLGKMIAKPDFRREWLMFRSIEKGTNIKNSIQQQNDETLRSEYKVGDEPTRMIKIVSQLLSKYKIDEPMNENNIAWGKLEPDKGEDSETKPASKFLLRAAIDRIYKRNIEIYGMKGKKAYLFTPRDLIEEMSEDLYYYERIDHNGKEADFNAKIPNIITSKIKDLVWNVRLGKTKHTSVSHEKNFFARIQYLKDIRDSDEETDENSDSIAVATELQGGVMQDHKGAFGVSDDTMEDFHESDEAAELMDLQNNLHDEHTELLEEKEALQTDKKTMEKSVKMRERFIKRAEKMTEPIVFRDDKRISVRYRPVAISPEESFQQISMSVNEEGIIGNAYKEMLDIFKDGKLVSTVSLGHYQSFDISDVKIKKVDGPAFADMLMQSSVSRIGGPDNYMQVYKERYKIQQMFKRDYAEKDPYNKKLNEISKKIDENRGKDYDLWEDYEKEHEKFAEGLVNYPKLAKIASARGSANGLQALIRELRKQGVEWLGIPDKRTAAIAQWGWKESKGEIDYRDRSDEVLNLYEFFFRRDAKDIVKSMGGLGLYREGDERVNANGVTRKAPILKDYQKKDSEFDVNVSFWIDLTELDYSQPDIVFMSFVNWQDKGIDSETAYDIKGHWIDALNGDFSPENIKKFISENPNFVDKMWKENGMTIGIDGVLRAEIPDDWATDEVIESLINEDIFDLKSVPGIPDAIKDHVIVWVRGSKGAGDEEPHNYTSKHISWFARPTQKKNHAWYEAYPNIAFSQYAVEKGYDNRVNYRKKRRERYRSTLLHEIQHYLQWRSLRSEGYFAEKGDLWNIRNEGNNFTEGYDEYRHLAHEIEAREVEARIGKDAEWRALNTPEINSVNKVHSKTLMRTRRMGEWDRIPVLPAPKEIKPISIKKYDIEAEKKENKRLGLRNTSIITFTNWSTSYSSEPIYTVGHGLLSENGEPIQEDFNTAHKSMVVQYSISQSNMIFGVILPDKRIDEFEPDRKIMANLHGGEEKFYYEDMLSKGAKNNIRKSFEASMKRKDEYHIRDETEKEVEDADIKKDPPDYILFTKKGMFSAKKKKK